VRATEQELTLRQATDRLARACRATAASILEFDHAPEEGLCELRLALLTFERATLAPDDEHTEDRSWRLQRILDRWDEALAAVTEDQVRAYLDRSPRWEPSVLGALMRHWPLGQPDPSTWQSVLGLDAAAGARAARRIAAVEGRHLALVLTDLLPRRWGLDR